MLLITFIRIQHLIGPGKEEFYLMKTKMKVCHVGDESLSGQVSKGPVPQAKGQ